MKLTKIGGEGALTKLLSVDDYKRMMIEQQNLIDEIEEYRAKALAQLASIKQDLKEAEDAVSGDD